MAVHSGVGLNFLAAGDLLFKLGHEDGGEDADDAQADQHPAHGRGEQYGDIALRAAECVPEALFTLGPKIRASTTAAVFRSNFRMR